MDMEAILDELYQMVIDPDPERIRVFRQSVKAAEPYYERLCAALGDEEGENIWNMAMDVGATSEGPAFRAGLCLGLRLMALCL